MKHRLLVLRYSFVSLQNEVTSILKCETLLLQYWLCSFQIIPTLLLMCGPNAIISNQKLPPREESGLLMPGGYLRRFVHYV